MKSAVLLIIFKRPDLTCEIIDALRRVRPARLYVAGDGPRPGRGEEKLCAAARACLDKVDWPCELATNFAEKNMGTGLRVSSAITWFFEREEEGIILEDDCMPDDSFFRFCDDLLERYRNQERVMAVSGYHGPAAACQDGLSYWFSKYTLTWGWATWRRAWRNFDIDLATGREWEAFRDSPRFGELAPAKGEREHWVRMIRISLSDLGAWDILWMMTCWMRDGLTAVPCHNLIKNVGFRADAAHTKDDVLGRHITSVKPLEWPLKGPAEVEAWQDFDRQTWIKMYRPFSIMQRVRRKLLLVKQFAWG